MKNVRIALPVFNLSCASDDGRRLERALLEVEGVRAAHVNPATEMAYIEYDPARILPPALEAATEKAGFGDPNRAADLPARQRPLSHPPADNGALLRAMALCSLPLLALIVLGLGGVRIGPEVGTVVLLVGLLLCGTHYARSRVREED